jgi:uncharacterized delta-60 repeat protein
MKKFVIFTAVFFMLAVIRNSSSQEWLNTYNGTSNGDDRGYGIAVDGNDIYTTGFTTNDTTGQDIILIKYNNTGGFRWKAIYRGINGNHQDRAWGIAVDGSGNVIVTGYTTMSGNNIDYVTIKFNSNGTQLWAKTYNGTGNGTDQAWGIVIDEDDNIYITGTSRGSNNYDDCVTIKYTPSGTESWVKRFDGNSGKHDGATAIAIDNYGYVYITGYTSYTSSNLDYLLVKYNSSGSEQWNKRYNGNGNGEDKAWGIAIDNSTGDNIHADIYITGYSLGQSSKIDAVTMRYNESGTVEWTSRYNSSENHDERGLGIIVDSRTNSVYVRGTIVTNTRGTDFMTLRYNTENGSLTWARLFDGLGHHNDAPNCMTLSRGENAYVIVAGTTRRSTTLASEDIAVVAYSTYGDTLTTDIYNGEANIDDGALGIVVDANNNYYIAGYLGMNSSINSSAPGYDMLTMKYESIFVTGIIKTSELIPGSYRLYQNYPNPFNPSTTIKFDVSKSAVVKISVYDITGKEIETLLNNYMTAGTYEVSFNNISLSSGVYFYRLTTGNYSEIKKMTLVK